jgi:choline-sulfatase
LTRLATKATGTPAPAPIDPLDGCDLLDRAEGDGAGNGRVVAEYLGEGTGQPMLMIRRGSWKYTCCPGDPEQLFDLAADPDELDNRANDPVQGKRLAGYREEAAAHWDAEALRAAVIADQHRRRVLSGALREGRYQSWDWQPPRDAAQEYTRSHLDLTDFDVTSRWPRPVPFTPKWR